MTAWIGKDVAAVESLLTRYLRRSAPRAYAKLQGEVRLPTPLLRQPIDHKQSGSHPKSNRYFRTVARGEQAQKSYCRVARASVSDGDLSLCRYKRC